MTRIVKSINDVTDIYLKRKGIPILLYGSWGRRREECYDHKLRIGAYV